MPDRMRPENPFGTRHTRPGALPYITGNGGQRIDPEALARQVADQPRAAIVGPHGTGKTTLLTVVRPHLEAEAPDRCGWTTLRIGERPTELWHTLARLPDDGTIIIDGYEQLGLVQRLRLIATARRRRIRLLVTAHRPPAMFTVVARTGTSRQIARRLAAILLERFPAQREAMLGAFDRQWDAANGNIRQLWATLYDDYEYQLAQTKPESKPKPHE